MTAAGIARALGGAKRTSDGWLARCPLHKDKDPSLKVTDRFGDVLVHCFAGCDWRDVRDELKGQGLIEEPRPRATQSPRPKLDPRPSDITARAMGIWSKSRETDPGHAYLVRKAVKPTEEVRQYGSHLVVPVQKPGTLCGLQSIAPDGRKKFMKGTAKKGSYCIIGDPSRDRARIYLVEGVADALSVHEATGLPAVCAFDAGNLLPAAETLRPLFTSSEFVFVHDGDEVGIRAARKAAKAVAGLVA